MLKTVCARNAERAQSLRRQLGLRIGSRPIGARSSNRPISISIDIASPNDTHAEIAIAAAKAGKMVMCEKPLGRNASESEAMVGAVEEARRAEHGLVQLPPRSRRHAGEAI